MKGRAHLALLAVLAAMPALAQEVSASSTTILQNMKQDVPGFSQGNFTPATEFLGVDVNRIGGQDALSMHLYGWGMADLGDQSSVYGKNAGNLTYGYLQYHFAQANGDIKAGRVTVNQGLGPVQMDGFEARTDLRWGFTVSGFAGRPVVFKNLANLPQNDIAFQQDVMFGGRFAWRAPRVGEIGLSYLQDGHATARELNETVDFTRKQAGADISLTPVSFFDLTGRTVFNMADDQLPTTPSSPTRVAEHDYKATAKLAETLSLTGTFTERYFYAYYAGTTLPSLFNQDEQGMFRAVGASATWGPVANLQIVADVRRTARSVEGIATRAGADVRYSFSDAHVLAGAGFHRINAFQDSITLLPNQPMAYSLSHNEMRAWAMLDRGNFSASLDALHLVYAGAGINPDLNGHGTESAIIGSVGYKVKTDLKVSADLTYEDNALYKQTMGLARVEYRFGFAGKGDK